LVAVGATLCKSPAAQSQVARLASCVPGLGIRSYNPCEPGGYGHQPNFIGPDEGAPVVWEPEFSLGQLYDKGLFLLGYAPEVLAFCESVLSNGPPAQAGQGDSLALLRWYEAHAQPAGQWITLAEGSCGRGGVSAVPGVTPASPRHLLNACQGHGRPSGFRLRATPLRPSRTRLWPGPQRQPAAYGYSFLSSLNIAT
jgi:hypothetical protein